MPCSVARYFWQLAVIVSGERPTFPVRHVSPDAHGSFVFGLHPYPTVVLENGA
jgi:hypothetical protein